MNTLINSIISSFVATVALSVVMIFKSMMGLMPELNVITMLGNMMGGSLAIGWMAHFIIGTVVWGAVFALLSRSLPGKIRVSTGMVFGAAAWLLMMIFVMPMAGAGLFGLRLGMAAPVMTLMLHALYGAILALTFNWLQKPKATGAIQAS